MTQSYGWNLQRLQHSRNKINREIRRLNILLATVKPKKSKHFGHVNDVMRKIGDCLEKEIEHETSPRKKRGKMERAHIAAFSGLSPRQESYRQTER